METKTNVANLKLVMLDVLTHRIVSQKRLFQLENIQSIRSPFQNVLMPPLSRDTPPERNTERERQRERERERERREREEREREREREGERERERE